MCIAMKKSAPVVGKKFVTRACGQRHTKISMYRNDTKVYVSEAVVDKQLPVVSFPPVSWTTEPVKPDNDDSVLPMSIDYHEPAAMEVDWYEPVAMEIDWSEPVVVPMEIDYYEPVAMQIDWYEPVPMDTDEDDMDIE